MKDLRKLKDLVVENVNLADVMEQYGVHFTYSPKHADEVQYKCPFHGKDNKPSARLYNTTESCWCFYCKKRWDVISFIEDKEKLSFINSIKYIINRYHVDTSSIPDDVSIQSSKPPEASDNRADLIYLKNNIVALRQKIDLAKYKALCMGYLMVEFAAFKGADVSVSMRKLGRKLETVLL